MRQATHLLSVATARQGLYDVSDRIDAWVRRQGCVTGLLTVFCRHTSASLLIQENAASEVRTDLEAYFSRLAPEGAGYLHDDEGPDDMPAHLRSALTQTHLSIPLFDSRLTLGTWQGIYLFEHRRIPHTRTLALHLLGE